MTSVKRPKPSDRGGFQSREGQYNSRIRRTAKGVHAFDTEARSLEQACEIIAHHQELAKKAKTRASHPPSLRQEFGWAKNRVTLLKRAGKISLASVGGLAHNKAAAKPKYERHPHPFKDLPEDGKRTKAQEMYVTGSWGIGLPARRRLAKVFGVPLGAMVMWLDESDGT